MYFIGRFLVAPQPKWCHNQSGTTTKVVPQPKWCHSQSGATTKVAPQPKWCHSQSGATTKVVPQPKWCHSQSGAKGRLTVEISISQAIRHTHTHNPASTRIHTVGILRTRDEFVVEAAIHKPNPRNKHPFLQRDSNTQSHESRGRFHTY
jgi:hypothetical protein